MRIRRFFVSCSVLLAVTPSLVCAQDTHKVGITMAYPAAFGVLWHASKNVAIRPVISFGGSSSDTTTSVQSQSIDFEGDSWSIGTGVSALFYLRTYDHLRTYFSPQFTYAYTSSSTSSNASAVTGSSSSPVSSTQTGKSAGAIGSFGAQYMLGDRFSVFGEFGFGFAHTSNSSSLSPSTGSGNSWGTRAGVGVVFYP